MLKKHKKGLVVVVIFVLIGIASQVGAFSAAIQAVLSAGGVVYSKLLVSANNKLVVSSNKTLVKTSATQNWNQIITTSNGTPITTGGNIIRTP